MDTKKRYLLSFLMLMLTGCYGRFEPYQDPVITVTPSGVQVPECKSYDISDEEPMVRNCFVESARWQMMVNPEKAVAASRE